MGRSFIFGGIIFTDNQETGAIDRPIALDHSWRSRVTIVFSACNSFFKFKVVVSFFNFHPYLGKIPILTNIFQMSWNHQAVLFICLY